MFILKKILVSHAPERTEKNCLNCGTTVVGRFCHVCGQENVVPKESFWHLVVHFFYDITHFDSKFFDSLKFLIFRPGFLPREYMSGRRASYLNPVRMYVFTSAFFFIVFFTLFKSDDAVRFNANLKEAITPEVRDSILNRLETKLAKAGQDSSALAKQIRMLKDTATPLTLNDLYKDNRNFNMVTITSDRYLSQEEYDSVQHSLPAKDRDGWIVRQIQKKQIEVNGRYRSNPEEGLRAFSETIMHKLPYLLFISLPLFALILKLLYIRRKEFFYADHGIFTIYHYIFSFILLLFAFGFNKLQDLTGWGVFGWINFVLYLLWLFYLYKGMRNFYRQRRGKTILKYILLHIAALVVNIVLLAIFFFLSVFTL